LLPPQGIPLLLTLAVSALIGIGLRDYYEREGKFDTFGTVRIRKFTNRLETGEVVTLCKFLAIATASNNLMKAVYVYLFGNRRTAHLTALGMAGLALLSFVYVAAI
jgi:hypothetical protein